MRNKEFKYFNPQKKSCYWGFGNMVVVIEYQAYYIIIFALPSSIKLIKV
jgi:hypothetical protein